MVLGDVVVDQHFLRRNRVNRLLGVLHQHPGLVGIGIDEDTAIIVRRNTFEVYGKPDAAVLIYDPRKWTAQTADAKKYITLKL